jgi:hypothetical protein
MPYKIIVHTDGEETNSAGHNPKIERTINPAHLHRLDAVDSRKRRNPLIHWVAMTFALISWGILVFGMVNFKSPLPVEWVWLDLALSIFFLFEFFTRSGFRWHRIKYIRTHVFDFIAIVPAFLFLHHGVFAEYLWVWLVLVARSIRMLDRILSDGFIEHNFFALLEGMEEETTDRVVLRIEDRIRKDLVDGKIGHSTAQVLENKKSMVLRRIRAEYPRESFGAELARFVGLEAVIEQIEERIYDAVVDVLASSEANAVIQEEIDVIFAGLRSDIGKNEWRKHLGLQHVYNPAVPKSDSKNTSSNDNGN